MVKPVNVNGNGFRVGALLRRAQILNEHKIVIGSTEFDYDAMTVQLIRKVLFCLKKNSCFYISLQLRQAEYLQTTVDG